MKKKKNGNPLVKRVPRELLGEWRKYLVIFILLTCTIGFVAGMYVANHSMLISIDLANKENRLEDGHFELENKADEELLTAIASGEKVDLRLYYIDEAHKEIDEKIEEEAPKKLKETVEEEVRKKVKEEITNKVTEAVKEATAPYAAFLTEEEIQKQIDETVKKTLDEKYEDTVAEVLPDAIEEALKSKEYLDEIEKAKKEAYEEAEDEINEEFDKQDAKKSKATLEAEENFRVTPVTVYENFFKDVNEDNNLDGKADGRVRLFSKENEVNNASFLEGRAPEADNEIAIDRMHADNNDLHVGDTIRVAGKDYTITGLLAYVNYSTLYEKNTDLMFDAINFDVAMVTENAWNEISGKTRYSYAFFYKDAYGNDAEEKVLSDNFMQLLLSQTIVAENELQDYVPGYSNQAVNFAPEDMGSDKTMGGVLLYILVVVLGFIFALTIMSTITKESTVIGTLRASGYTKGELVRHYMTMPVLVTLVAAIVGNILGYTVFKNTVVSMYFNSYSLPAYHTYWYYEAFLKTTVMPVILMILINFIVVRYMLRLSPLRFIRRDLKVSRRKKAMRLPRFKFLSRFRLRVILQNIPNYLVLFVGIFFVVFLATFAFGLETTLKNYQDHVVDDMFAKYQYILKTTEDEDGNEIKTSVQDAEKFSMESLYSVDGTHVNEPIGIYGIEDDSIYFEVKTGDLKAGEVFASSAYQDKFKLHIGDEVTLKEKYSDNTYTFKIAGFYNYIGGLNLVMGIDEYNEVFGYPEGFFNGYLSNEEINDIDDDYVAMTVTEEDVTKVSRQLDHSMGSYMNYFKIICLIFAGILIYLLTKVIIEKNENSISMVKILGYKNGEIASLYLLSTTWMVVISAIISSFFGAKSLELVWLLVIGQMDGWLPSYIPAVSYVWIVLMIVAAYMVVMLIDYGRIRRIPMDEALKNVE
ncbi:MAG: FtsX-like permease family protein [Lachnospiraceae bacterium]|nr:FtsX-like permease family protein [Lachnospiraceae bacterium]